MGGLAVEIVSAEKQVFSGSANMVVVPAGQGEIGILPKHAPLLTNMKPGIIKLVDDKGEEEFLYVAGGIVEVQPERVTILADVAERGEDLDEARIQEARDAAEKALQSGAEGIDYAQAQAEFAQAAAQLELLRKIRKR